MTFLISFSKAKKWSLLIFEIQFPTCSRSTRNKKWSLKIKWIILHSLIDDYDDYNTPNTSRVDKTSFTEPATTKATSTLQLTQKVKQDKLASLYRHLNVTGNIDLIDITRFKLKTNLKKGVTIFEFYNGDRWVALTKQTGEFFAPKTLRHRFGGVNTMKNFLGTNRTPPALEGSLSAASKLKSESPTDLEMESIPPMELLSLKIFMLKHKKHHKIPVLICKNF